MADHSTAVIAFITDALKRFVNNPAAWKNPDIREWVFEPIIEDAAKTYIKRLENTEYNSATSYSTDGYSATADTSDLFAAYTPILHHYRKPRTVSQNDSTDWSKETTV